MRQGADDRSRENRAMESQTTTPMEGRASPIAIRSRLTNSVRRRAFEVLLRCFADSIGAEQALAVAREPDGELRRVGGFARAGREPQVSFAGDGLIARCLESEEALLEPASENGDGDHRHAALAVAVSSDERVVGALHAAFDPPSAQPEAELSWAADYHLRLCRPQGREDPWVC